MIDLHLPLGRRGVNLDMNSWINFSSCLESRLLSSSPIYRRQLFLIRSLGGYCCKAHMDGGQGAAGGKTCALEEADAEIVIRKITPVLDPKRYKGQAGKFHCSIQAIIGRLLNIRQLIVTKLVEKEQ